MLRKLLLIVATIAIIGPAHAAPALQHIDAVEAAELVLYTATSTALVREHSSVRLRAGGNTLTFSWTSDRIDAATVRLHAPEQVAVGETVRPAGVDRALQWTVTAGADGDVPVSVSYLVTGVSWTPAYRLRWEPGTTEALLTGQVTVTNESGVELEDVRAQVVLGRPGTGSASESAQPAFPITGLDALPAGASVRAGLLPRTAVNVRMLHRIDSESAAEQVRSILVVEPPATGALAREALPTGAMRVVVPQGERPPELFDAELKYEPGDSFEVDMGVERDVLVDRELVRREKTRVEFDRLHRVSGFDTVEQYRLVVHSYRPDAIDLEIVETVVDTWDFKTEALHVVRKGAVVMRMQVPPGGEQTLQFTIVKHSGTRIP